MCTIPACSGCQTPSGNLDTRMYQACRRAVHDERMEVIRELEARQEARDQQLRDDWLEN